MNKKDLLKIVSLALKEDVGTGDITANLIGSAQQGKAHIVCREAAILCGTAWLDEVYHQLGNDVKITWHAKDGDSINADQIICDLEGPARALLTGERTALNFLQTLSGTATTTHQFVSSLKSSKTHLLDTRKTLPGLRVAQKYAVQCGGGKNHRMGLFDAFLIKENHILACGSITRAVQQARAQHPHKTIEVEVENLNELQEALANEVEMILLDNFDLPLLKEAVVINAGRAKLEVSGGIAAGSLSELGSIGVDYISVGALTKHVRAVDFSMRFTNS